MRIKYLLFSVIAIGFAFISFAQPTQVQNDSQKKQVTFGNKKISLLLDYNQKANIALLVLNGQKIIDSPAGVYSTIQTSRTTYSTLHLLSNPTLKVNQNEVRLDGIKFGDNELTVVENWTFLISESNIQFRVERTLSKPLQVEKAALPIFTFNNINSWEGAYQDYGGIAWFYLFNKKLDTYGVHSNSSRFWNSSTGNGLTISVDAPGNQVAMDYSRTASDQLTYSIGVSPGEMLLHFDSVTQRRRYTRDRTDVWAPFEMPVKTSELITLSWFDAAEVMDRGKFVGIDETKMSAVLNTIARIGVIDKQHFGGNSWHTPYGPICLHEQYIAQFGLAINDPAYLKGYQQCLDYYRDHAFKADGRVWPRWAYSNEDMMPGEVTSKGFYEAQWGYLLDSNPDFVTNVAELYDQNGDLSWVKSQQAACEKALDWIIQRDSNHNGLVEMITDSHKQRRGSDWIDIIWASYENAFVSAKLYHALELWANIESQLGNHDKENAYRRFASQLKTSFNKSVSEGGFWDDQTQCYIHWRDKDGSIHGNNMVTPVNFMAIAYGICDDHNRTKTILDNIESQMKQEKLFFWPICMTTYGPGEGNDWQFPFPNYENGDLFLSWGAVAVKAYASYKPEIAIKYVNNVLTQYSKDGLAFQRYGRAKQDGLGDDILSGNALSVVGLYQAIYGINPLYNRFYLNPHITPELAGTQIKYDFRNSKLLIELNLNSYSVSDGRFKISSGNDFGFNTTSSSVSFFNNDSPSPSFTITTSSKANLDLRIIDWGVRPGSTKKWVQSSSSQDKSKLRYEIPDQEPNTEYRITQNSNRESAIARSNEAGLLIFEIDPAIKTEITLFRN